ncbi:hypothetical protein SUGI_0812450 [Cryptomeria japonica]|nr:hypothetical protein SUGI_0812450 [Cryptomeria japonica]
MGCPTSKLDSEDAVFSCKERRLPVKQAEQHRHCAELELYIEASLILISQETFIEWQETRELFIMLTATITPNETIKIAYVDDHLI